MIRRVRVLVRCSLLSEKKLKAKKQTHFQKLVLTQIQIKKGIKELSITQIYF